MPAKSKKRLAKSTKMPAKAKASTTGSEAKATTKRHKARKEVWDRFVYRILKATNDKLAISTKSMTIINSLIDDIFERIAEEASNLCKMNKRATLGSREIQTAVRLVFPSYLARHAVTEGTQAVRKFSNVDEEDVEEEE
ncbi:hypothetical protein PCE1_001758 [Barthelona sp. PCE]